MTNYPELKKLIDSVDKEIVVQGKISNEPWQHLIGNPQGYPFFEYFDLIDGYQTIIYSKEEIKSRSNLKIHGLVTKVEGKAKGSTDPYWEYHITVHKWENID